MLHAQPVPSTSRRGTAPRASMLARVPGSRPLHVRVVAAERYIRPAPPAGGRGGPGRGAPRRPTPPPSSLAQQPVRLDGAIRSLAALWREVRPQHVPQDPSTGVCGAPASPGAIGRPTQVLTNHMRLVGSSADSSFRVRFSAQPPAASAGTQQAGAAQPSLSLEQRQQLVEQLAQAEGWPRGAWLFEPSACVLYSQDAISGALLASGTLTATLSLPGKAAAAAAGKGTSKARGKGAGSSREPEQWQVTISTQADAASTPDAAGMLGLLTKASLASAVTALGGVVDGRGQAGLVPPGTILPRQPDGSEGPGSRGGPRGGGQGGRAAGGRGGGRGDARGRGGGGAGRGGGVAQRIVQHWDTFRAAIKATQQGPTLQLDVSAGAVQPAGPLSQLLASAGANPADLVNDRRLLAAAQDAIKGAKVQLDYFTTGPRVVVVKGLDARTPARFTFKDGAATKSVAAYYRDTYNISLKHGSDWPCVMISKTAAIPLELCTVVAQPRKKLDEAQTAQLIRLAALPPSRRLAAYRAAATQLLARWAAAFKGWGFSIVTSPLLQVDARVLPDALLQHGREQVAGPANTGQWRTPAAGLAAPQRCQHWAVLNLASPDCSTAGVQAFAAQLAADMKRQGMSCAPPLEFVDGRSYGSVADALDGIVDRASSASRDLQLVLVVLPSAGTPLYSEVKRAALARSHLVTQCVVASTAGIRRDTSAAKVPYLANLTLKLNVKLGGTNWQLPSGPAAWAPLLGTPHVMLLGVDVSHAAPGGSTSSMAAVVGSLDAGCSQYGAVILEQTARHEVVLGMVEGAQQLLQAHYDARGLLPQSLLVFRDGVSDSMYASVLQQEVAGIRAACRAVGSPGYSPKVTLLVVSKRHGSRLFPAEPEGPDALKGNVLPGTVVDTQLVNPLAYEFFLNSHAGIQGTNRPARFNVLLDEHDLGPDGLQLLAFHLSSIYCACSRTLSDPAPARYADKAAAAGAFVGGRDAVAWQVVQPAQASVPALQYRVVVGVQPAAPMWYV